MNWNHSYNNDTTTATVTTLADLKNESYEQWQDCEELSPVLDQIEENMQAIGAKYIKDFVWMYGVKTTPREKLCYELSFGGLTKVEFFELIDNHIVIA